MDRIKRILKGLSGFRRSPKKWIITGCLGAILIALSLYSYHVNHRQGIPYTEILDEVALSLGDTQRTFREVAFYVAYEEAEVDKQAVVYNPEKPEKYWNLHVDGIFIRIAARNAAAQMALHDEYFYQMAMEEGITLNEDEQKSLADYQEDFWNDLTDDGKAEKLGVTKEEINATMERMMYAQKMQLIYANLQGAEYEDYDFSEEAYENLIKESSGKINENLWKKLAFGSITLSY